MKNWVSSQLKQKKLPVFLAIEVENSTTSQTIVNRTNILFLSHELPSINNILVNLALSDFQVKPVLKF